MNICVVVQLIEHLPETVPIRRRHGDHLLGSSVDKAFNRDCLDWTKEARRTFA